MTVPHRHVVGAVAVVARAHALRRHAQRPAKVAVQLERHTAQHVRGRGRRRAHGPRVLLREPPHPILPRERLQRRHAPLGILVQLLGVIDTGAREGGLLRVHSQVQSVAWTLL